MEVIDTQYISRVICASRFSQILDFTARISTDKDIFHTVLAPQKLIFGFVTEMIERIWHNLLN